MFQKVMIIGNLGSDPEQRAFQNNSVTSFSVATNRKWTNSDGTPGSETVWWRVSAWGGLGEVCAKYLTKGQLVFIEGQMKPERETGNPRTWLDQNGQARASFEIRADTMKMLGGRRDDGYNSGGGNYGQSYNNAPPARGQYQGAPARQAAPAQAAPARQAAPAPRQAAPAPRQAAPAPRQAAPQRPAQPARRDRRSAMAPPPSDFDDSFGPDEIPF